MIMDYDNHYLNDNHYDDNSDDNIIIIILIEIIFIDF